MGEAWTFGDARGWGGHAKLVLIIVMLGLPSMDRFAMITEFSGGLVYISITFVLLLVFGVPFMFAQVG